MMRHGAPRFPAINGAAGGAPNPCPLTVEGGVRGRRFGTITWNHRVHSGRVLRRDWARVPEKIPGEGRMAFFWAVAR